LGRAYDRTERRSRRWARSLRHLSLHGLGLGPGDLSQPRLELGRVLLGELGAIAKGGRFSGLREVQQDEDCQPDDRGKTGVGAHRTDEVMD
jgi:hypothetical protein